MTLLFSAGTVTATGGSPNISFSGSGILPAHAKHGDEIRIAGGYAGFIDSVDYANQTAVVSPAFSGTNGSGKDFSIRRATSVSVAASEVLTRTYDLLSKISAFDAKGTGLFYRFSTTNVQDRYVHLNNADPALVTELSLSTIDVNDKSTAALIATWRTQTLVMIRAVDDGAFAIYRVVVAPALNGMTNKVGVQYLDHDGVILLNHPVVVGYVPGVDYQYLDSSEDAAAASAADALTSEQNAKASENAVETDRVTVGGYRNEVEADRAVIEGYRNEVEADRAEVETKRASAAASATNAAQSFDNTTQAIAALGLPAVHVASNFLRRTGDNSGFEYRTAANVLSDIGAQSALSDIGQVDAEAGTSTISHLWTAQRVRQAVAAYAATKVHTHTINEIIALQAALDVLAAKASPDFTGNPTAPTQLPTDNSTRLATTAFVKLVVSDVIANAPGALDTLNELAAALGDDPNFATTILTALAGKATKGLLSGGAEVVIGGTQTITAAHNGKVLVSTSAAASTWTLDTPGTLGVEFLVFISNTGLSDLTVAGTFDNGEVEIALERGQSMALTCNGSTHRLLLRGGGTGGGGSVIPLRETIQGNGGAVYPLTNTPASKDAIMVFVGGAIQSKANFSIAGNQLTLGGNVAADEKIEVQMLKGGASVVGVAPLYRKNAGTGTAGPFTLQATPVSTAALTIHWNGLVQPKDGTAYTLVGDQITFSENIPVGTHWEETILQAVGIGVPNPESVGALEIKASDVAAIRTKLQIQMDGMPVGTVIFSPTGAVFPGFLALEGETFAQATYPSLYTYLGSTTLPDFRNRVARGAGTLAGASGTTQEDALQGHFHNTEGWTGLTAGSGNTTLSGYSGTIQPTLKTSAPISDGTNGPPRIATETRVKAYVGRYLIKAFSAFVDEGAVNMASLASEVVGKVNKTDIVGTLVSTGNGKIIERGSNANGDYVKFADGTMICTYVKAATATAIAIAYGATFITSSTLSWVFPVAFVAVPVVSLGMKSGAGGVVIVGVNDTSTTSASYYLSNPTSQAALAVSIAHTAVGRWF